MAIASSSKKNMIDVVVDRMKIRSNIQVIHSAEFEKAGKPEPFVFLSTAKKLNVSAENCLVFEDSIYGVQAALSAGMQVIAIPPKNNYDNKLYKKTSLKLKSMTDWLKIITEKY